MHAAAAAAVLPLALSMIPAGTAPGAACGVHCGSERWSVKTLSDDGARTVMTTTPREATVASLIQQAAPLAPAAETRVSDLEQQIYTVKAELVGFKQETADRDFHIVIQEPGKPDQTMIVEIPDPQCAGVCASVARDQITAARNGFLSTFASSPPTSGFQIVVPPIPVTVVGVPLFDFFHKQTGVATNCIELHPVLKFDVSDQPHTVKLATTATEPQPKPKDSYHCVPRGSE
jgi:hypothetical protein